MGTTTARHKHRAAIRVHDHVIRISRAGAAFLVLWWPVHVGAATSPTTDPHASATDPADAEAYALITQAFALAPYGPEGDRAEYDLIQRSVGACMADRGFDYTVVPFVPNPPLSLNGPALLPPTPSAEDISQRGYEAFRLVQTAEDLSSPQADAAVAENERRQADPVWSSAYANDDPDALDYLEQTKAQLNEEMTFDARTQYQALLPDLDAVKHVRLTRHSMYNAPDISGRRPENSGDRPL